MTPVREAAQLRASLDDLTNELNTVTKVLSTVLEWRRRSVIAMVTAVAVLLLVLGGLTFGLAESFGSAATAQRVAVTLSHDNFQRQLETCRSANTNRIEASHLWSFVLRTVFAPNPRETPRERVDSLHLKHVIEQKVAFTYAPKNCLATLKVPHR